MKIIYLIFYLLVVGATCNANPELKINDDLAISLENELVDSMKSIKERQLAPKDVIEDLKDKDKTFGKLSKESQKWLSEELGQILLTPKSIELYSKIEWLLNDDGAHINTELFIEFMRGQEVDLLQKLRSVKLFRLETRRPEQVVTPIGRNKIVWIWTFAVKEREHGILHVGIDIKTRNFVCYENTIGIYYPEGGRLQFLHKNIVQNSDSYKLIDWHLNNIKSEQFKVTDKMLRGPK